jgi:hypothetical protein
MKNLKIIVAFHDKSYNTLPWIKKHDDGDDTYVPVYGGAAYGNIPEEYKDMLKDNDGENISLLNHQANEITHLYWAWKNYEKLGNPEYIGLNHYRRITSLHFFKDLDPKTIYVRPTPYKCYVWRTITSGAGFFCDKEFREVVENELTTDAEKEALQKWYLQSLVYNRNIFVMHKDMFDKYMQIISKAVLKLAPLAEESGDGKKYHLRYISFIMELVSAFTFIRLQINENCKLKYVYEDFSE